MNHRVSNTFMRGFTSKQLEKAHFMAEIFERFEKTNLPVRDFCRKEGIHTSKFYYWRDRFRQEGLKGLVDKRQGRSYKATEEVKRYIHDVKIKDPSKSAFDICILVERRFNKSLSDRHIRRVLEELGLNDPPGRKPGKRIKKTK
jgi:transposase